MKVAVDKNGKIVDLLPDKVSESSTFVVSNGYIVLDVVDPVSRYVENEDGSVTCEFRELVPEDYVEWNAVHWKEKRQELVDAIEVVYDGIAYQGDETSQDRMSRAIVGMPTDASTIQWKAKDNSVQTLTRVDLREILFQVGQKQTEIWFMN